MNKWLTKGLNVLSMATHVVGIGMICSCSCGKIETPNDVKYLSEFQEINFESNENWLTSDNLSLYVDYSTCMAQALKTSPFFSDMIPSLTAATKNFYSIKGDSIKKETGKVFTLLSSIHKPICCVCLLCFLCILVLACLLWQRYFVRQSLVRY
jgi:hypothetical protein